MKKAIFLTLLVLLTGCTKNDVYTGDVYSSNQVGKAQSVSFGTILSLKNITIQTNAQGNSTSSAIGTVGGGVVGGILGSAVGGGIGRSLATAAGAIGGAIIGSDIENRLEQTSGVQMDIRLNDGSTISVVQKASAGEFYIGQKVQLTGTGSSIKVSPLWKIANFYFGLYKPKFYL